MKVFIRTVSYHYIGEILAIEAGFVRLGTAAWVADSGRWNQALTTGQLVEVEPYLTDCFVAVHAIVDVTEWTHALPTSVK